MDPHGIVYRYSIGARNGSSLLHGRPTTYVSPMAGFPPAAATIAVARAAIYNAKSCHCHKLLKKIKTLASFAQFR